ncbi:hypothetical protein MUK42_34012 [Musa troglodytarum]|uniref:Uncharacterized protein n=1 Tax=Musa troglodytarum TaxID=320322 RepID=A0A9E7K4R3_9LILI|nr:hypothetical protein MUK42_34012 [Musa troglodytarum]
MLDVDKTIKEYEVTMARRDASRFVLDIVTLRSSHLNVAWVCREMERPMGVCPEEVCFLLPASCTVVRGIKLWHWTEVACPIAGENGTSACEPTPRQQGNKLHDTPTYDFRPCFPVFLIPMLRMSSSLLPPPPLYMGARAARTLAFVLGTLNVGIVLRAVPRQAGRAGGNGAVVPGGTKPRRRDAFHERRGGGACVSV